MSSTALALAPGPRPALTSGRIAVANLTATIGAARRRVARDFQPSTVANLVVALLARGAALARVDDVQAADHLSGELVATWQAEGVAHLTRARTDAALHRFDAALARLDQAETYAAPARQLAEERAMVLQATGQTDDALELWAAAATMGRDSHVLGRLACVQVERGALDVADALFAEAVACYRDVSPIALAGLYRDWGHVHEHAGDWVTAEASYRRAIEFLPCHARAQLGAATAEIRSGRIPAAISRLRPVCVASDDPTCTGTLGVLLRGQGADPEATDLLAWAHHRFAELLAIHPEAFAGHAAEFRRAEESSRRTHPNRAESSQ